MKKVNLSECKNTFNFVKFFNSKTLDGSDTAEFLEIQGYKVKSYRDTGRYGVVETECGFLVSTNGYISNIKG